jgi:CheY-like chemotaxis protein
MDGYTAARQIRSRQRLQARIPIVALTANAIAGARTVEVVPLISRVI